MDKPILDATCGGRSIWFDKNNPACLYIDNRNAEFTSRMGSKPATRHINVRPDMLCDFTAMPFADNTFSLVVFDPPHLLGDSGAWLKKAYGFLDDDWRDTIKKGFSECMRVLKPHGTLIFKWSEVQISTSEVINAIGYEPLFGHRSGKKMNTHWMAFMKLPSTAERNAEAAVAGALGHGEAERDE